MILIRDPSGLAESALTLSMPALPILCLLDGEHTLEQIQQKFFGQSGQILPRETLEGLLATLAQAHFLEGPAFERHYDQRVAQYRGAATRRITNLAGLGLKDDEDVAGSLARLLPFESHDRVGRSPVGVIAPHLDYQRGQPCYLAAYAALTGPQRFRRYIILGTNHFGRASAAVATGAPFATPLGVTYVDRPFLEELENLCRGSLRDCELDHEREHSIELQVMLLQHLVGPGNFEIVPVLCPNPCGPSGTAPDDGRGVDLQDFAVHLRSLLQQDDTPTCLIAAADLSHVGGFFGDQAPLTPAFLERVAQRDRAVLQHVEANNAERFREQVAWEDNATRICSAGCIYALMTALPDAKVTLLEYHQAVHDEQQCAVTCAAAVFEIEG